MVEGSDDTAYKLPVLLVLVSPVSARKIGVWPVLMTSGRFAVFHQRSRLARLLSIFVLGREVGLEQTLQFLRRAFHALD